MVYFVYLGRMEGGMRGEGGVYLGRIIWME